jgi:hypothetical protein
MAGLGFPMQEFDLCELLVNSKARNFLSENSRNLYMDARGTYKKSIPVV